MYSKPLNEAPLPECVLVASGQRVFSKATANRFFQIAKKQTKPNKKKTLIILKILKTIKPE